MKQAIFRNKKGGWYIYGTNYKDKSDVAYLNLFFPKNSEPLTNDMQNKVWIDIQEASFTSFKNKLGLTIFKYVQLTDELGNDKEEKQDNSMFGGSKSDLGESVDLSSDNLPFY